MSYHYMIEKNGEFINFFGYNLNIEDEILVDRKIYKRNLETKINRNTFVVENKIMATLPFLKDKYKVFIISDKCRILLRHEEENTISILEMDGYNYKIATEILRKISENDDGIVMFDIDDSKII